MCIGILVSGTMFIFEFISKSYSVLMSQQIRGKTQNADYISKKLNLKEIYVNLIYILFSSNFNCLVKFRSNFKS